MPWKVFTQSLALTNFGDKLANDQFIQRLNASYCLNIAPKWGDSVFELFCCHLENHFEVIQEKSAHVIQAHLAMACKVCFIFVFFEHILILLFETSKLQNNLQTTKSQKTNES